MDPTNVAKDQYRVSRRRNRPPVSCAHCRIRKLKCSRTSPCEACVRTGDTETCSYVSRDSLNYNALGGEISRDALEARIDRLEVLLLNAMANTSQPPDADSSNAALLPTQLSSSGEVFENRPKGSGREKEPDLAQLTKGFGVMKVDHNQNMSSYLGGEHWVSIMCEIEEFRDFLAANHEDLERDAIQNQTSITTALGNPSSLLRGVNPPTTRDDLIRGLPPRAVVDKLVDRFFSLISNNFHIIHEPTFRKEYLNHWSDPSSTRIIWLAVLFGMLELASMIDEESDDGSLDQKEQAIEEYKTRLIQSLVTADYTNPETYTVEALMFYIKAEWMRLQDVVIEISLVIGMVIRLAMRMGMHRDSNAHPEISPFQGEMRRRIWAVLHQMDILFSFQISLPATVRDGDSDCSLPRNIFDADFDESTAIIPRSMPSTEVTEVSYNLTKYRLVVEIGNIVSLVQSKTNITLEDVQKHDKALRKARQKVPPHLQLLSFDENIVESVELRKQRINIDRIFQAGQCILHRRFLLRARHESDFTHCRRSCIDAALNSLSYQAAIFLECGSNYPQNVKRRHVYFLTTHDFFIAGMAVALDLHYGSEFKNSISSSEDVALWGYDRKAEMVTALEISTEFWRLSKDDSVEAAKAYGMFSYVLTKVVKAQVVNEETMNWARSGRDGDADQSPKPSVEQELRAVAEETMPDFNSGPWNTYNESNYGFDSLVQWSPNHPNGF